MTKLVAMTFEEASRWIASQEARIRELEAQLAKLERETRGQTFQTPDEKDARIEKLESALQLIGNELSLHADQGPAGEAFRALLVTTLENPVSRSVPTTNHKDLNEACEQIGKDLASAKETKGEQT